MTIELLTMFYGEEHLEMFFRTLLPSLLLSTNLPRLAETHSITHHIYCTPTERDAMHAYAAALPPCVSAVVIDTNILAHERPRAHLVLCVLESMERSCEDDRIVIVCQCDHVFGHGLAESVTQLLPGEYLVCPHPRISFEAGFRAMADQLATPVFELDRSNASLVNFCLEAIPHPLVSHGLIAQERYWHALTRHEFFEVYAQEPPPLAFRANAEMLSVFGRFDTSVVPGSFELIDHDLVDDCLRRRVLRSICDSRDFFWAEFTSTAVYTPTIRNDIHLQSTTYFQTNPSRWWRLPLGREYDPRTAFLHRLAEWLAPHVAVWMGMGSRVVIYGAGAHAHALITSGCLGGVNLVGIVDRNPVRWRLGIAGHTVLAPDGLSGLAPDVVLLCTASGCEELATAARLHVSSECVVLGLLST